MSNSSQSFEEKEKDYGLGDPQAAAVNPTENEPTYEPIKTAKSTKDLEANFDSDGTRGTLSRVQTGTSTFTDLSEDSDAKSSLRRKKWYKTNPLKWGKKPSIPKTREVCPEYRASIFSRLTWQWMQPLMQVGYMRPLENNDIWTVNPDRSADVLAQKLETAFTTRKEQGKEKALLWAMFDTFKWEFILGGMCQLTSSLIQSIAPFVLRYLINFAVKAYNAQHGRGAAPNNGEGFGLVIAITVLQFFQSLATNHFMYRGMMIGGEARGVLIVLIFNKAMKLSGRAKAGGKALVEEAPPPEIKPGSEEHVKWYKKMLKKKTKKEAPVGTAGVAGDGEGWGNGRIVNLMSTDTYRVDQASGFFHMAWTAPIGILVTTALLLVNLTYSALPGLGLIIFAMPVLANAVKVLFRRRMAINKITDQRVSLTQEILQGVRFVKYFGWETSFLERIQNLRKKEIHSIQILLTIRNAILAVGMSIPVFASMISFITYSQVHTNLSPAPIFSSLALFNSMRIPLNFLPLVIGQIIDANASVNRIQEFLLAEEAEESAIWDYDAKEAVVMKNADFTWERHPTHDAEDPTSEPNGAPGKKPETKKEMKELKEKRASALSNQDDGSRVATPADSAPVEEEKPFAMQGINLTFGRNELVAIIGSVGSGKSSLLAALAGDMRKTSGEVVMGASRAFCPQYAWIQNANVRENIVFGKPFKQRWYDEVVDACALRPDLEMLPAGDKTEIGERGITVSGGQKQRMNIARAIYFDADIILMDDPLSAVDAHVGRHIMDNAICGLLKNKCRILATHQLHVLDRCDRIIWVEEGRVQAVDTFDALMANNEGFQHLMKTTKKEEEHEKAEEAEELDENAAKGDKKDAKKTAKRQKKAVALMQVEERATKSVSWGVWIAYIKAGGGIWVGPLVAILLILSQGANIVTSLWLSYWTSNKFGYSKGAYIGAYAAFGVSQALFTFLFSWSVAVFGTEAGKTMLHRAITRVLRAPMSFFDTTPLGRITNRFSKDIDVLDNTITDSMRMYFITMAMIISVFILIVSYYYYYAIALGPLFILFMFSAAYYRSSAREVKRHEAVLRSTVFARFGEAVMGTPTIRAYGLQNQFSRTVMNSIDDMNSAYYLTFANQRWLSVRLDLVGILLVFTTGILVVTSRFSVNPSIAGLVLSYILTIVQMIQFTVRQLAEVENNMNSTERIHHYGTELEEEAPLHMGDVRPTWPEHGEIVFENVEMRYRDGLPLVLKGLSMHVRAGERIGVVGRTGAGKSSIMSALFRLQELSSGAIVIDGVDIGKIGLHDLRSKLAIIPQDPTLFKGTIRSNLDPFHEHSDLELWASLRQANLVGNEQEMSDEKGRIHLDSVVEEEGLNFSLGQRQLMALARALVRGSRIIVCDEATSSVDFETDALVQRSMKEGFEGRTLLVIAHRLRTILDYDRICVMDAGLIAELDTPSNLYKQNGIFKGMCERSGIRAADIPGST